MTEQHPENVLASLSQEFDALLERVDELETQTALTARSYLDLARRLDAISPPSLKRQYNHALGAASIDDLWQELTRRVRSRMPDAAVTLCMAQTGLVSISTSVFSGVHTAHKLGAALDSAAPDYKQAKNAEYGRLADPAPKLEA